MHVNKGGQKYGFCPAKATWDYDTVQKFRLLIVTADTGALLEEGPILEQPAWYMELLGWFLPLYDQIKWNSKMRGLFGNGKSTKANANGVKQSNSGRQKAKPRIARRR